MPRFAANLSMLFTEHAFLDRFEHAAGAGFEAVEFLFPYDHDLAEIRARLDRHGLQLVLHNLPAGAWEAGERGIACHPDRVDEFHADVERAVACATALGVRQLNCLAGIRPPGVSDELAHRTLVTNLRRAADRLGQHGLKLLVEPINSFDIPGFFVTRTAQALALLDEVGAGNVFLQYDIYHAQRMEGEIAATLERHLPRIGHVQIADNPGRHEPGSGELHFGFLFRHLDAIGYTGWVGCEYKPAAGTDAGLRWLEQLAGARS